MAAPKQFNNTLRGYVRKTAGDFLFPGTWDQAHDATIGTVAFTAGDALVGCRHQLVSGNNSYTINRTFMTFDFSKLPPDGGNVSLTSASLSINVTSLSNEDVDGDNFIVVVGETTPDSDSALITADFDQCSSVDSPTELTNRISLDDIVGGTNTFMFDATGLATLLGAMGGNLTLGIREGHDVRDLPIALTKFNQVGFNGGAVTFITYAAPQVV